MKVAKLSYNTREGRWEATYNGTIISRGQQKQQIINYIRSGNNAKANKFGVTDVEEIPSLHSVEHTISSAPRVVQVAAFPVSERFGFLEDFVEMVIDRKIPSLIVTGESGLGKTYTVFNTVDKAGLINTLTTGEDADTGFAGGDYVRISGHITPGGLYERLYLYNDKVIILDDCDKALEDKTSIGLLKAALDSYDKRVLSWFSMRENDSIPPSFEFTGRVIFISNKTLGEIDPTVRSRSLCVDLSMTDDEKITRMEDIIEDIAPDVEIEIKIDALDFLKRKKDIIRHLNLRTFLQAIKIRSSNKPNWEKLAEYTLGA